MRVLDIAAGNGVSGEALAAAGLRPVLGTDIVPSAREAALRDRPGLYDQYLILDLLALTDGERAAVTALQRQCAELRRPRGRAGLRTAARGARGRRGPARARRARRLHARPEPRRP